MPRFLYYFPGLPGVNAAMLRDRGVWPRFGDSTGAALEYQIMPVMEGPEGAGCIVAPGPQIPTYAPASQRWEKGPQYWVGIEDFNPTPQDLARDCGALEGYELPLGDGCAWRVPLILRWEPRTLEHVPNVPKSLRPAPALIDGKRRYVSVVRPEYQGVCAIAQKLLDGFMAESAVSIDSLFSDAVELLAVNYRIGIEEAGLLGLLDEQTALRVARLAVDQPAIAAQAASDGECGLVLNA